MALPRSLWLPSLAEEVLSLFPFAILSSVGPGWGSTPPIINNTSSVAIAILAAYEFTRSPLTLPAAILAFLVKIFCRTEQNAPMSVL